ELAPSFRTDSTKTSRAPRNTPCSRIKSSTAPTSFSSPRFLPFSAAAALNPLVAENKAAPTIPAVVRSLRLDSSVSAMTTSFLGIILKKLAEKLAHFEFRSGERFCSQAGRSVDAPGDAARPFLGRSQIAAFLKP